MTDRGGVRTVGPMTAIGADPDALDAFARALSGASGDLDRAVARIDAALRRSGWSGPDAERFHRSWRGAHRGRLTERADALRTLGLHVRRHAAEQRRASFSTFGTTGATRIEPMRDATVVDGELTASVKLLSGSVKGTVTIEEAGDRRLLTYSREAGIGVDLSTGAGIEVHAGDTGSGDVRAGEGAAAGASAFVEGVRRETFSVDAGDVPLLLAGLVAREGVGVLSAALPGASVLVERAADTMLPDPVRTEHLAGVEVAAGAWVAKGGGFGPASAASVSGQVRVGVAESHGESTLVLEADGDVAAALVATPAAAHVLAAGSATSTGAGLAEVFGLGRQSVDAAWSVRVEAPLGSRHARPLLVTATSTTGESQLVTRIAIDRSTAGPAASQLVAALESARSGDVRAAVGSLRSLRLPEGSYDVDFTMVALDRSDGGGSVSTPVPGVSVDGSITKFDAPAPPPAP